MSNPQPGIKNERNADAHAQLRRIYARHFATVQRLEARRLAAANRRSMLAKT